MPLQDEKREAQRARHPNPLATMASPNPVAEPLTLRSGLILSNRLFKAAMAENLADKDFLPTEAIYGAYKAWGQGGWGLIITGNVQVDPRHLGQARDIANNRSIPRSRILQHWRRWASASKGGGSPVIVQISHPGRQSPAGAGTRGLFEKTVAPSAIGLRLGKGLLSALISAFLFGTPKSMTISEIQVVRDQFVDTAILAAEAGFDGVEIHGAHGYLLAQFLAEKTNQRTDDYGGTPAARAKIVVEIITAIRASVPANFTVGIKFNSVDHQSPSAMEACLEQLRLIVDAGIDFLEISGGSYEEPIGIVNPDKVRESTKAREAFFLDFASAIRDKFAGLPLLVTGGFRSRAVMSSAISSGALDAVGLARPAVLNPSVPNNKILDANVKDHEARAYSRSIESPWILKAVGNYVLGAGFETAWYVKQIAQLGNSNKDEPLST